MTNHKENNLILGVIYDFLELVVPFIRKRISTPSRQKRILTRTSTLRLYFRALFLQM